MILPTLGPDGIYNFYNNPKDCKAGPGPAERKDPRSNRKCLLVNTVESTTKDFKAGPGPAAR